MNKLEVGMWVRDKNGNIGKIIDYNNEPTDYYFECYETNIKNTYNDKFITEYNIDIKASFDIIDLIQVGDYVNGMKVTRIGGTYYGRKNKAIYCEHNGDENWKQVMIYDDEIKSIVTHEQFERVKYEVK